MPTIWTPSGSLITDEKVEFLLTETIDGSDYYIGFLSNYPSLAIADSNQTDYGVFTEAGKDGDRKTVLLAGVPADSSEIVILPTHRNKVISLEAIPLYFTYLGCGEIPFRPKIIIDYIYEMENGVDIDHIIRPIARNLTLDYYTWFIGGAVLPNANVTLYLRDSLDGAGNSRTLNFGIVNDSNRYGKLTALSSPFSFNTSNFLVIRGDGKGISDLHIEFF